MGDRDQDGLADERDVESVDDAPAHPWHCGQCGRRNVAESRFCMACGAARPADLATHEPAALAAPAPPVIAPVQVNAVAAVVTPSHSTLATVALLAAVGAIVAYPLTFGVGGFLLSIVAVILGHLARAEIRHSNGLLAGDGAALAALIVAYLSMAVVAPIACAVGLLL